VKFTESFVVAADQATVWEFFDDLPRVARCVPGVEDVQLVDEARLRVRMRQKLGFLTATFDMRMNVTTKEPPRCLELSSIGRSIRGAVGDLRATNRVDFEPDSPGATRVILTSDVAMGGMLGSVGHKVVAAKARETARLFAAALDDAIGTWAAARATRPATGLELEPKGS
jgi:uncharacterized protein